MERRGRSASKWANRHFLIGIDHYLKAIKKFKPASRSPDHRSGLDCHGVDPSVWTIVE
jgi:hypothetical protein